MTTATPETARPLPGDYTPSRIKPGMLVTDGSQQALVVLAMDGDTPGSRVRARHVGGAQVVEGVVAPDHGSHGFAAHGGEGTPVVFAPLELNAVKSLAATGLVSAHAALRDFGVDVQWPPQDGRDTPLHPTEKMLMEVGGGWFLVEDIASSNTYYTVGLHTFGFPELWLSGFPFTAALSFCREAVSVWVSKRAIAQAMGSSLSDFTEAFPMVRTGGVRPAYVVPLDDHLVKELAPLAHLRTNGNARLAQIVEPDLDARFAWEDGCTTRHLQRVMCAEPVGFQPFAEIDGNWVIKP